MSKSIKLNVPNQEDLELPVLEASIGHDVVDIRALTKSTGLSSFDPGFVSTASCEVQNHLYRRRRRLAVLPWLSY